jgi:hypothetical protein
MEPIDVTITDYQQMVDLFHAETDRGAAVLAGSYVENFFPIGQDLLFQWSSLNILSTHRFRPGFRLSVGAALQKTAPDSQNSKSFRPPPAKRFVHSKSYT